MNPAARPAAGTLATAWVCLTLAAGFLLWSLGWQAGIDAVTSLGSYLRGLPAAGAIAALAAFGCWLGRAGDWAIRASAAAGFAYVGGLTTVGFAFAPWAGLALAAGALYRLRRRVASADQALILMHLIGTLTAVYLGFTLDRYWPGADAWRDLFHGLALLITG